jgi:uncharacterized delta-60 repeat protein
MKSLKFLQATFSLIVVALVMLLTGSSLEANELDPIFGSNGRIIADLANSSDSLQQMRLDSNGSILILAGHAVYNSTGNVTCYATNVVLRYTSSGALDTTLKGTGKLPLNNCSAAGGVSIVTIAPTSNGKFLVVSTKDGGSNSFAAPYTIVQYNANGTVDTSFSKITGGFLRPYNYQTVGDVRQDAQGRILVSGGACVGSCNSFVTLAMARYLPTGKIDPSFGNIPKNPGMVILTQFQDWSYSYFAWYHRMVPRSDGTIALVGEMPLQSNYTNNWTKGGMLTLSSSGALIPYATSDGMQPVDLGGLFLPGSTASEDAANNLVFLSRDFTALYSTSPSYPVSLSIVTRTFNAVDGSANQSIEAMSSSVLNQMTEDCFNGICSRSVSGGDAGMVLIDSTGGILYGGHSGDMNYWWHTSNDVEIYRIIR